jgi:hypothetical protein
MKQKNVLMKKVLFDCAINKSSGMRKEVSHFFWAGVWNKMERRLNESFFSHIIYLST